MNKEVIALESLLEDYLYGKVDINQKIEKETLEKEVYEFIKDTEKREAVKKGLRLDEAITFFLDDSIKNGNKSSTLRSKKQKLRSFEIFLDKYEIDYNTDFTLVTTDVIEDYIRSRTSVSESNYVKTSLQVLRAFYNYLERDRLIINNPMTGVIVNGTKYKYREVEVKYLENYQITEVLSLFDEKKKLGLRNTLYTLLLLESGLLPSEMINIKINDINFIGQYILVGIRRLYYSKRMFEVLEKYMKVFDIKDGYLFRNRERPDDKLRKTSITKVFDAYEKFADFELNPTILRNTFAKRYLELNGDMLGLSNVLNIRLDSCTRKYKRFVNKNKLIGESLWKEN